MSASRYANDAASVADGFGPSRAGDQVARMALEADPPFTICVTGKWGCGKTSVLRRAFATLKGQPVRRDAPLGRPVVEENLSVWGRWAYDAKNRKPPIQWGDEDHGKELREVADHSLCVWYSPWQHQGAENPLLPLLHELRQHFTLWMKTRQVAGEINRRGTLAALALLERVVDGAVSLTTGNSPSLAGTTDAVRKAWREAAPNEPELSDGQRFHLLFEDAVKTLLSPLGQENEGRLVFFIDDLDRCEETVVVQLLEAIKLYLSTRRCVFVLALDEAAVLNALRRHWSGRSDDANREYLEKLFQAQVPVPPPRPALVRQEIRAQLKLHGFPDAPRAAKTIEDLLEPNPRKIKNFVNSLCAGWDLYDPGEASSGRIEMARRFILFQYLRSCHKDVWRLLEREPWSLRVLTKVLRRGASQEVDLTDKGVTLEDQRLLEGLFFRAFAHVLGDDSNEREWHGNLPIGAAIDLFTERIDRKRSDGCFRRLYLDLITDNEDLLEELLQLPEV